MKKILFSILFVLTISCSNKIKFYHGYIYNSQNKPLKNLKVEEDDNLKNYSFTDESGYFKIIEKNTFGGNLIISKENVKIDTIWTVYSSHGEKLNYRFINGRNDTLRIDTKKLNID